MASLISRGLKSVKTTDSLTTANINGRAVNAGEVSGEKVNYGALTGTLSVHYGADGQPGKDGFSPTITVHQDDETTYILKITDENGTIYTPNLKANVGGFENVEELIASKVDVDLAPYDTLNPITLNASQKETAFLYAYREDVQQGNKVTLNCLALKEEVDEQIRRKMQTTNAVDKTDWKVGDYIFLEIPREDS